jgi:NAD(P)-dependent dehydrogenase (short-subunit alcohol dehydrogenase family)
VNNAGLGPGNLTEDVREEDFDFTLAVNLKGTFLLKLKL